LEEKKSIEIALVTASERVKAEAAKPLVGSFVLYKICAELEQLWFALVKLFELSIGDIRHVMTKHDISEPLPFF
jgi:hypothetical protein